MDVRQLITQNLKKLSPQELKVAHYILENLDLIPDSSVKKISRTLDVSEGAISKTLTKLEIGGFKQLKFLVTDSYYLKNEKLLELTKVYHQKLIEDIERTFSSLKVEELEELVVKFLSSPRKIILFATGKTKILLENFYFILLEWGFAIEIYSSLYDVEAYDVKNKIVIVSTISGENQKVEHYLHLIQKMDPYKIIGITSSDHFRGRELVDLHLYGSTMSFFSDNPRTKIVEKYPLLIIFDTLFLLLMQNLNPEDKENLKAKTFNTEFY